MDNELLNYFRGDELAASTWEKKYALHDELGNLLEATPDDMHKRLAREFFKAEEKLTNGSLEHGSSWKDYEGFSHYYNTRQQLTEQRIYSLFKDFKYIIPGGSVMAGLGASKPVSLSNCFVLPSPEDSYSSIMMTRLYQTELMKRRGGVGYDLSSLRPRGSKVNNAAITSTGAASFMDVCSDVTNEVAQQGRRGALMISLSIDHPDVEEFIERKQDLTKVTGANVSVQVTNAFMVAVKSNEDYLLRWPLSEKISKSDMEKLGTDEWRYGELHKFERNGSLVYAKKVNAKQLWDKLIHCAWNTAEPGIIFKDTMVDYAPDGVYDKYRMIATNPCGEIPMSGAECCRLMAINLRSFVTNAYDADSKLDLEKLWEVSYEAMRLGDDLVELDNEAIRKIIEIAKNDKIACPIWESVLEKGENGRRVGVGFTALADMCAALNLKFGSDEANEVVEKVMKTINSAFLECQVDLAIERGHFKDQDLELERMRGNSWYDFIEDTFPETYSKLMKYGRRNISYSTVAPVGTISMLTQTTSGIEPLFMPYYTRRRKCVTEEDKVDYVDKLGLKFSEFVVVHEQLRDYAVHKDPTADFSQYTEKDWQAVFEGSPWHGACAQDIDWKDRVEIQSIIQKNLVSHSCSSTVNLPSNVTEEEVANIYMHAWEMGLKGITVYRDGCREGILIKKEQKKEVDKFNSYVNAPKRPKALEADFYTTKVKGELFYVIVGLYNDKPYEVFVYRVNDQTQVYKQHKGIITKIKRGLYEFTSDTITINDLSSQLNVEEKALVLYSSMLLRTGANIKYIIKVSEKIDDNIAGFAAATRRILSKYMKEQEIVGEACPECGGRLVHENGCIKCLDCAYSKCL